MIDHRIEVKWLNGKWRSFSSTRSHFSAGIGEIVELVEAEMAPAVEPGEQITWRTNGKKFVAEITDEVTSKLSKSDQD